MLHHSPPAQTASVCQRMEICERSRLAATRRGLMLRSMKLTSLSSSAKRWGLAWSASRQAARTTTRTSNGQRSSAPSDGYAPPEDPLVGVARMIAAARRAHCRSPECRHHRIGLLVPPAVAAARCPDTWCEPARVYVRRHRPQCAELPGPPSGCARRSPTANCRDLSNVQRLHHGATQWSGVGLLSARSVLQRAP